MKVALCPGTFDPVTNGHLDVIYRAAKHFDEVVVAVAENPEKGTLFSVEERVEMLNGCLSKDGNIKVVVFDSLLVDLAHEYGSCAIVKGLRAMSDFEFEFQMAQFNRQMDERIETFFVMASPEYTYLSSSGLKAVARYGGSIVSFVPGHVKDKLLRKYNCSDDKKKAGKE
ncbi:MAG: pantetheine-phosphate adenylyltransferase [Actinobacteria bacterium]|nr:pantetheine-phosphate adenylyltransferase [Actinomycetota bacterium]